MPDQPQYFEADQGVVSEPRMMTMRLPDMTLDLATDRGVFSGSRVDPGTDILLREGPTPPAAGEVLDLGCGYGPIAFAIAHRAPATRVWAVDVNRRALELVRATAERLEVTNVEAAEPDEVPADICFTAIYSNPPIRIGKEALHALLLRWLGRLAPDGRAHLVVQKHLGSDSLAAWLILQGYSVERVAAKRAYRVLTVSPDGTPNVPK